MLSPTIQTEVAPLETDVAVLRGDDDMSTAILIPVLVLAVGVALAIALLAHRSD